MNLVLVVKAARENLAMARAVRAAELQRRINEARITSERMLQEATEAARIELDNQIAVHESALDEALIAAYNDNVPQRRVALDGFGLRYDGTVTALYRKLRDDGRLKTKGPGRKLPGTEAPAFPEPVDVETLIDARTTAHEPIFEDLGMVEIAEDFSIRLVKITLDWRDPYFNAIASKGRLGLPPEVTSATSAQLYLDHNGAIAARESTEPAYPEIWDHPVARWVKDYPDAALAGYNAAIAE